MRPLGQKPRKFPGKVDSHPRRQRSERNWWEAETQPKSKRAVKAALDREARKQDEGWAYESIRCDCWLSSGEILTAEMTEE